MSVATPSRQDVRRSIGRGTGLLYDGEVYAVTVGSPSQVSSVELPFRSSDQGLGLYAYISDGPGAGLQGVVVSASAVGPPSGSVLYLDRGVASVPSSSSSFELWKVNTKIVHEAIDDAIREAQLRVMLPHTDYGIIIGDHLRNGAFDRWNAGDSSAPDNWTLTGSGASVAKNTNRAYVYAGRYSMALTNGASQAANIESDDIPNFPAFAGETITVKAKIYTTTASRVTIEVTDGVTTTESSAHDGNNGWDGDGGATIAVSNFTIAANPTKLTVNIKISSGGAITPYIGRVWVEGLPFNYEYELPARSNNGFTYISEVWAEGDTDGVFDIPVAVMHGMNPIFNIDMSQEPRRMRFTNLADAYNRPGFRQLKIVGLRFPVLPTAETSAIEVDPEFVRLRASQHLIDAREVMSEMDRSRRDRFEAAANGRLDRMQANIPPDSIPVETI